MHNAQDPLLQRILNEPDDLDAQIDSLLMTTIAMPPESGTNECSEKKHTHGEYDDSSSTHLKEILNTLAQKREPEIMDHPQGSDHFDDVDADADVDDGNGVAGMVSAGSMDLVGDTSNGTATSLTMTDDDDGDDYGVIDREDRDDDTEAMSTKHRIRECCEEFELESVSLGASPPNRLNESENKELWNLDTQTHDHAAFDSDSSVISTSPVSTSSLRSEGASEALTTSVSHSGWNRTYKSALQTARSITRVDLMDNLSHYISDPDTTRQMGHPSAVVVAPSVIAIGTSYGFILLFANNENRITVLKITDPGKDNDNSVTAMDITPSGDCIVAGYERGQIVVWDTKSRSATIKITDSFSTSIDFLSFLHDRNKFIASSQGSVKMFSISKMLFSHFTDAKTIIDGAFGPVRHLHVLPQARASHETNDYIIIALATDQEVMVLTLQPIPKVIARMMRPEDISRRALPYLAWRRVLSSPSLDAAGNKREEKKMNQLKGKNPILAIGWGNVLNIFQLRMLEKLELFKIQTLTLEERFGTIRGMAWLGERIIAVLESNGHICLFDPFSNRASLECKSVDHIEPVSHARFHVSDTSTAVPAYHHSFYALLGHMYLLGERGALLIKALTWKDRIDALLDIGFYDDAFSLGIRFFNGSAIAAVGLPTETLLRREIVGKELTTHLLRHFHETVRGFSTIQPPFTPTELQREYAILGKKCLNICLHMDRSDLIFNDIFAVFKSNGQQKVFFDIIEQLIMDRKLNHIPMEFVSVLFQAYSSTHNYSPEQIAQNLNRLENIILNLYIPCSSTSNDNMDNEFVTILMEHCAHYRMYKALIYLYNTAKDEYITPIILLLDIIVEREMERDNAIVEMLFDYIDQCFHGEAFPSKERNVFRIPHHRLFVLKRELLNFMFKTENTMSNTECSAQQYRYLNRLLRLNAQRIFRTLLFVFLDDTPTSPWNQSDSFANGSWHSTSTQSPDHCHNNNNMNAQTMKNVSSRQEMVRVLYKIMVDETVNLFSPWEIGVAKSWPSLEDMDVFYRFVLTAASKETIDIDSNLMQRAIVILCWNATTVYDLQKKNNVQNDIIALLRQKRGQTLNLDFHNVINVCEKAGFHKVIVELQMRAKHFDRVLESYLKDHDLQKEVFVFINETLSDTSEASSIFKEIKTTTMNNLSKLMHLNSDQTTRLIIRHFSSEYKSIINKLKPFPRLQYEYLKNIIQNSNIEMNDLLQKKKIELDEGLYFRYFTLMCQFDKSSVYEFLKSYQKFRIDKCLKVCQKYGVTDATSYLLERSGDIPGAIDLYQKKLQEDQRALMMRLANEAKVMDPNDDSYIGLDSFRLVNREIQDAQGAPNVGKLSRNKRIKERSLAPIRQYDGHVVSVLEIREYVQMKDDLQIIIDMCRKNTDNKTLDPGEAKAIWFELLDVFVQPLRELRSQVTRQSTVLDKETMSVGFETEKSHDQVDKDNSRLINGHSEETQSRSNDVLIPGDLPILANLWLRQCYSVSVRTIFEQIIGYIPLEDIVSTIATRYRNDEFGHFKGSLIDLYDKYEYEMILYRTMRHLIRSDSLSLQHSYIQDYARGVKPVAVNCFLCNTLLFDPFAVRPTGEKRSPDSEVCMFHCGHGFHMRCLNIAGVSNCPTCRPDKLVGTHPLNPADVQGESEQGSEVDVLSILSKRLDAGETKLNEHDSHGTGGIDTEDDERDEDHDFEHSAPKRRLHEIGHSQIASHRNMGLTQLPEIRVIDLVSSFDELLDT